MSKAFQSMISDQASKIYDCYKDKHLDESWLRAEIRKFVISCADGAMGGMEATELFLEKMYTLGAKLGKCNLIDPSYHDKDAVTTILKNSENDISVDFAMRLCNYCNMHAYLLNDDDAESGAGLVGVAPSIFE